MLFRSHLREFKLFSLYKTACYKKLRPMDKIDINCVGMVSVWISLVRDCDAEILCILSTKTVEGTKLNIFMWGGPLVGGWRTGVVTVGLI